jgi:protein-disulfide isomerase
MKTPRRTLAIALAGAVVVAGALATVLILVSRGGGDGGGGGGGATTSSSTAPSRPASLRGVPQNGIVLGNPSAPALYEYADIQCPFCADATIVMIPDVIAKYVRTGKIKLVWHGLAFLGPDSLTGLRAIDAAAEQNRLWDMVERLYTQQGTENSGWVTTGLLEQVGAGIAGLDVEKWKAAWDSDAVNTMISEAESAAKDVGVGGTPTFVFKGQHLQLAGFTIADFSQAIDPLLG